MFQNYFNLTFLKILTLKKDILQIKNNKSNINYSSVQFATLSLPCFNYYKNLFYNSDNLKIVPSNIKNLFTPKGLAYWIMVDGSLKNKGLHLNTYGFISQDILNLKITLENMFGENTLKCSIHNHKKGQIIYICE